MEPDRIELPTLVDGSRKLSGVRLLRDAGPGVRRTSYGFTFHQSGHRTLLGVRVARTMVACSSAESRRSPSLERASCTSHGSSMILALGRKRSSLDAMRSGSRAEFTLPGVTKLTTIV